MKHELVTLIVRNTFRHRLRTVLTIFGVVIALFAFAFIQTILAAWYSGVEATSQNRLVVRNAVSLVFYLPRSYYETITHVPGIEKVGYGNWFGGRFERDEKFLFQQFAIDQNYLDIYPEWILTPEERSTFSTDRSGILVGEEIARRFALTPGDVIQLRGTIYPGLWKFTVSGILRAKERDKDTRLMVFHWEYLNERNRGEAGRQPDHIGFFVVQLQSGASPAQVSERIDEQFRNSSAETLTETETAFVQGFLSMSSTILTALNVISVVVIGVMLLVLTNTMLMSARERYREYAILKSLGFGPLHLSSLLLGEACCIGLCGLVGLCVLLALVFNLPKSMWPAGISDFLPNFTLKPMTVAICFMLGLVVSAMAGLFPALQVSRLKVTEAMRRFD